jgi:hypothetical protein
VGVISTAMVVTSSDRCAKAKKIQPGNREWVTVIQCVNSQGWAVPPFIVVAGKNHLMSWYQNSRFPPDCVITVTDNGWTTNEKGMDWIQHFEKHTRARTIGSYRLLILDSHESHYSDKFEEYCKECNIITLCMPAYSSYILQPLDVGCFSLLKKAYSRQIEDMMRAHIIHITKDDFFSAFHTVDFYREDEGLKKSPPYGMLQGKNLWPQRRAELKETYKRYLENMLALGEALMTAMGSALGEGNSEIFVQYTQKSFWGMRLIGYAPIPKPEQVSEEITDDSISCGAHTDYGCVTFLLQDSTKGALQVKSTSGEWISVDPIPGAFVVNIGDMMERWTNGLWRSTIHRVVHRGEDFRVSVPFFYEPDFNAR